MGISFFDGHCDTVSTCYDTAQQLQVNCGHLDLQRSRQLRQHVQTFSLFADPMAYHCDPDQLFRRLHVLHDFFLRELQANSDCLQLCRSGDEIRATLNAGRTAALLSIESADLLGCDPDRTELAADWGVRFVNLTWNVPNALSGTNCADTDRGLSDTGRVFVAALESNGIYPDVSHLSDTGFRDVMVCARGPVVATHSNARAICSHPRNLTDDQFRAIRDSGGVVGINFYREFVGPDSGSLEQLLRHVEHFLELDGEQTVAFGSDFDGCVPLCGGLRGLESIPALHQFFVDRSYSKELLDRIFFSNWMRLLDARNAGN